MQGRQKRPFLLAALLRFESASALINKLKAHNPLRQIYAKSFHRHFMQTTKSPHLAGSSYKHWRCVYYVWCPEPEPFQFLAYDVTPCFTLKSLASTGSQAVRILLKAVFDCDLLLVSTPNLRHREVAWWLLIENAAVVGEQKYPS